jgi:hypothetical protein
MADATAEVVGGQSTAESREQLATGFLMAAKFEREEPEETTRYDATHGRYVSLVAVINETPPDDTGEEFAALSAWLAAAFRASVRPAGGPGTPEGEDERGW